jgi:prepilin-type N-terminal cleavage/methylation domain-containing protein
MSPAAGKKRLMKPHAGFTLIELLVVVAIIVVLLALIVPALDRAINAANLTRCATNLKSIGGGAIQYATANKRNYPYRKGVVESSHWSYVCKVAQGSTADPTTNPFDDRPILTLNTAPGAFVDPLAGDFEITDTLPGSGIDITFSNYAIIYSMLFVAEGQNARMDRGGRKLNYEGSRSTVLAGDMDFIAKGGDPAGWSTFAWSSHGDDEGKMQFFNLTTQINGGIRGTMWMSRTAPTATNGPRGNLDSNYVFQDGSVRRFEKVRWNDNSGSDASAPDHGRDRMVLVPVHRDTDNSGSGHHLQLPNEGKGHD